jgi:hypothetical protein
MKQDPHPTQPVIRDANGELRFRENMIVCVLIKRAGGVVRKLEGSPEDLMQLRQLLGYTVDDPHFDAIRRSLPDPVTLEKKGYDPQPMQPVYRDEHGTIRFRENDVVRALLDRDTERGRVYPDFPARSDGGLNWIAMQDFSRADQEQFAQLIGYSISGYHELSYVSDESAARASELAKQINPKAGGCRDEGCDYHGGPLFDAKGQRPS